MTVTELAFFKTLTGTPTPEYQALIQRCADVNTAWVAANAPDLHDLGIGFFQQVEDPTRTMGTEHWDSPAQHQACGANPELQSVFPDLARHIDLSQVDTFHLADVALFPAEEPASSGLIPALKSTVISITRFSMPAENREAFVEAFDKVKWVVEEYAKGFAMRGGWRIEKQDEGATEEFVLVRGWDSIEQAKGLRDTESYGKLGEALRPLVNSIDVKHYRRLS
ncbi:hypothetical protein BX600DRAFT_448902 [Xylariales sp. PMI_506]|nr:hypothetical protein BX600DRAFT_448902 [Xylariales sp. PMI_506]